MKRPAPVVGDDFDGNEKNIAENDQDGISNINEMLENIDVNMDEIKEMKLHTEPLVEPQSDSRDSLRSSPPDTSPQLATYEPAVSVRKMSTSSVESRSSIDTGVATKMKKPPPTSGRKRAESEPTKVEDRPSSLQTTTTTTYLHTLNTSYEPAVSVKKEVAQAPRRASYKPAVSVRKMSDATFDPKTRSTSTSSVDSKSSVELLVDDKEEVAQAPRRASYKPAVSVRKMSDATFDPKTRSTSTSSVDSKSSVELLVDDKEEVAQAPRRASYKPAVSVRKMSDTTFDPKTRSTSTSSGEFLQKAAQTFVEIQESYGTPKRELRGSILNSSANAFYELQETAAVQTDSTAAVQTDSHTAAIFRSSISDRAKSIARRASALDTNQKLSARTLDTNQKLSVSARTLDTNQKLSVRETIALGETPSPPPSPEVSLPKPSSSLKEITIESKAEVQEEWQCKCCTRWNPESLQVCSVCKMKRSYLAKKTPPPSSSPSASDVITSVTIWHCAVCKRENTSEAENCKACSTKKNYKPRNSLVSPRASISTTRRESWKRKMSGGADQKGLKYGDDGDDTEDVNADESRNDDDSSIARKRGSVKFKPPPPPPKEYQQPSPPSRPRPKSILKNSPPADDKNKYEENLKLFKSSQGIRGRRRSGAGMSSKARPPPPKTKSPLEMERMLKEKKAMELRKGSKTGILPKGSLPPPPPPPKVKPPPPPAPTDTPSDSDDDQGEEDDEIIITDEMVDKRAKARHWSLSKEMKRDLEHVGLPARKDYVIPPSSVVRRMSEKTMSTSPEFDNIKKAEQLNSRSRRNTNMGISHDVSNSVRASEGTPGRLTSREAGSIGRLGSISGIVKRGDSDNDDDSNEDW